MAGLPYFVESDERVIRGAFDTQGLVERFDGLVQAQLRAELDTAGRA
jgi:hypothetical protein